MYRTTPLDSQIPSTNDLFGCKPQTTLPSAQSALKTKHPHDDLHQEGKQKRQEKQAEFYDNMEPVFVRNILKSTWKPELFATA